MFFGKVRPRLTRSDLLKTHENPLKFLPPISIIFTSFAALLRHPDPSTDGEGSLTDVSLNPPLGGPEIPLPAVGGARNDKGKSKPEGLKK